MKEEDYLWDRSGQPTPDLAHLEQILGDLRWSGGKARTVPGKAPRRWRLIAAAAAIALCVGSAFVVQRIRSPHPVTSWQLSLGGQESKPVRAGQVIETNDKTPGTMKSELFGSVEIEPNSRLRFLPAGKQQQRLALDHGTIHALIWARPARFVVDTPAAKAVDLGCQYTLHVDKDGKGLLTVEVGWVAFQWHNLESFIPAGAACTTRPGYGPDTPYFLSASPTFRKAVTGFDLTGDGRELDRALASAEPHDALTLWHLLQRTKGSERAKVFDRFAALVHLPPTLTRQGVISGERKSMDAAWDALQLGNTGWWREWKREW
jgi:hypothetical protein